MKRLLMILLPLLVAGCDSTRGFDRGAMSLQLQGTQPVVTDEDVQKALDLKPQLPSPFKLAICFQEPAVRSTGYAPDPGHPFWRGEDKDRFAMLAGELREKGAVSEGFVIPTVDAGADLKEIRLSAAQHGADAVLVVNAATDAQKYANAWAASYLLLVPMAVLPGSEMDVLVMTRATLWDVRNQYLYLSAEAEGTAHQKRAIFYIRKAQGISTAKQVALDNLVAELNRHLDRALAEADMK